MKNNPIKKVFMSLIPSWQGLLILLLLLLRPTVTGTSAPPPPPPPPEEDQLNNIIDALIGAGDFNSWANILSVADNIPFPLWATFFIPSDSERPPPFDQMMTIMAYHTVPQRLSFSQLRLMKPLSRLPTLLPSKSITISNSSLSNFTLDHSFLSHPDLYLTSSFAVHGIQSFLDYPRYNTPFALPPPPPPSSPPPPRPPLQGEFVFGSDAASLFLDLTLFFLVICGVWFQYLFVV